MLGISTLQVCLFLFGLVLFYKLTRNKKTHLPPGPPQWPLLGNLAQVAVQNFVYPHIAFTELAKKYGPVVFYQMGMVNMVVISGYETCKRVLNSDEFLGRFDDKLPLERVYSKRIGLIHGCGNLWKSTRRFTIRNLRDYGYGKKESLEAFAQDEIGEIKQTLDGLASSENGIFKPDKFFDIPFVNIIWALVTGSRFAHDDPHVKELVDGITEINQTLRFSGGGILASYPILADVLPEWLSGVRDCRRAMANFRHQMERLIESYRHSGRYLENPQNYVEIFLQHIDRVSSGEIEDPDGIFTEQNLVAILYDLFWAGSDTTSSTISYGILWLTINESVQAKLRQELLDFISKHGKLPAFNDKNSLPYTRATIAEIHRRSIIFPFGPRKTVSDTELNKFIIPKETSVLVNYYSVLMDESYWGDPHNFRPERFLDSNGNLFNTERVINFSLGKRNCVGESIAEVSLYLFITFLFSNFEFHPVSEEKVYDTLPVPGIVMEPPEFSVRLKRIG